jgi:Na+-translocating ferredoxin:NAD+ oxidoreductase RnfE subunit
MQWWTWLLIGFGSMIALIIFVVYRNLIGTGELSSDDSFVSKIKAIGDKCCLGHLFGK